MTTLEPYLSQHAFFRGLDAEFIQVLVGCASNVHFDAGEVIFRHGEKADRFFLIRSGRVSVEISTPEGSSLRIQTLGEGDVLGWSWLFPPFLWHFDASATELTRAVALDGVCLRRKCEEDTALGFELTKRFSSTMHERLQATRMQILDIYGPTSA